MLYQRSLYQSLRGLTRTVIDSLRGRVSRLTHPLKIASDGIEAPLSLVSGGGSDVRVDHPAQRDQVVEDHGA